MRCHSGISSAQARHRAIGMEGTMAIIIGTEGNDDIPDPILAALHVPGATLSGTDDADTIFGLGGNDHVWGWSGNDVIDGGTGADQMQGDDGDDTYIVDNSGDDVVEFAGYGNDTVSSSISYTLGDNVENLILRFGAGNINGTGNGLANTITGNSDNNVLSGGGGADHIIGGDGNDTLNGGSNNDTLEGGGDNDTLNGGSGADAMAGGSGDDMYYVDNAGDVVTEVSGEGHDAVYSTITFTLSTGVEDLVLQGSAAINGTGNDLDNLIGGNGADNTLRGLAGEDTLKGGGGDDRLYGGTEDDTLFGNDGDDDLVGGSGDDHMEGGAGNDTYSVDSLDDDVVEAANAGIDTVNAGGLAHYTLAANVENLNLVGANDGTGNNLDNVITGFFSLEHVLEGLGGNDTLIGGSGNDTATYEHNSGRVVVTLVDGSDGKASEFATPKDTAGSSFDTLRSIENVTGSAFDDQITGNSLGNVLDGRGGADDMAGGNGNDVYIVDNAKDVIHEFAGQGDADVVETSVSYGLASGVDVELLQTTDAFGTAAINLTGNSIVNVITGNNGVNTINGGGGADVMRGLGGNDTYIVDNAADVVIEQADGGTDHVKVSTGSYSLTVASQVEVLETTN